MTMTIALVVVILAIIVGGCVAQVRSSAGVVGADVPQPHDAPRWARSS